MMKKFLLLMSVIAIVFASCEKIPSQPTEIKNFNYVFKKKDGKILTGVEKLLAYGKTRPFIPIEYDRITTGFNNTFFLACKGDGAKVINRDGKTELDGMNIKPESIKYMGEYFYMAPYAAYNFEDVNGQKYWWFSYRYLFTGYDDLIPCCNGFVFRKHNK
ncbi:MAG: hypothetical protein NC410_10635, partial [Oscillibacter sp.]|nr:hypothetical protein [Oscillibacter sp.]